MIVQTAHRTFKKSYKNSEKYTEHYSNSSHSFETQSKNRQQHVIWPGCHASTLKMYCFVWVCKDFGVKELW